MEVEWGSKLVSPQVALVGSNKYMLTFKKIGS